MPKLKTHKGAAKRFKKTGTGLVVRGHAFARHILTSKAKKRKYRSLWIVRISAACKSNGISYSKFMHGLKVAGITLDRKILADVAMHDESGFRLLTEKVKAAPAGA